MAGLTQRARIAASVAAGAAAVALATAGIAGAASSTSSTATTPSQQQSGSLQQAPSGTPQDPAKMSHGPGETLLTGSTAASVTAAAKAALPGATVIRVETDSGGAAYEAHMRKADGSEVTLKLSKDFKVTATQQGFGSGPGGGAPPSGQAPGSNGQAPSGQAY